MLVLSRKIKESIMIGDDIEVTIEDIKGDQVRISIKAPREIPIYRQEIYQQIQEANRQAAKIPEGLNLGNLLGAEREKKEK
ncbi:MAG: carbon storage regulator CsrA [Peptococcia bacterium]